MIDQFLYARVAHVGFAAQSMATENPRVQPAVAVAARRVINLPADDAQVGHADRVLLQFACSA